MDKIKTLAINLLKLQDEKRKLLLEISANQDALSKAYCEAVSISQEPDGWIGESFLIQHNEHIYRLSYSEYEFSSLVDTNAQLI